MSILRSAVVFVGVLGLLGCPESGDDSRVSALGPDNGPPAVTSNSVDPVGQCGDGELDPGETCDGDALDGQSCESEGFASGDIACALDCSLDPSDCTNTVLQGNWASGCINTFDSSLIVTSRFTGSRFLTTTRTFADDDCVEEVDSTQSEGSFVVEGKSPVVGGAYDITFTTTNDTGFHETTYNIVELTEDRYFRVGAPASDSPEDRPTEIVTSLTWLRHPLACDEAYSPPLSGVEQVVESGDHVFVLQSEGPGVTALDIAQPDAPVLGSTCHLSPAIRGMALSGEVLYAYVTGKGIYSIDVADPEQPTMMSFSETPGESFSHRFLASGDTLYFVSASPDTVHVLSAADPSEIVEVGRVELEGDLGWLYDSMRIDGERLYVGTLHAGVLVYDLVDPEEPERLGQVGEAFGLTHWFDVDGDRVYIATEDEQGSEWVHTYDITDLSNPTVLRVKEWDATQFDDLRVRDDVLYSLNGSQLYTRDLLDEARGDTFGNAGDFPLVNLDRMHFVGDHLYATASYLGFTDYFALNILDVSDPVDVQPVVQLFGN